MALYSVWDWNRNAWRVYRTSAPVSVGDDPIPPPGSGNVLGSCPDEDIKPLPGGAKLLGYSHVARGEIRRKPRSMVDLGDDAGQPSASRSWLLPFAAGVGATVLVLKMRKT